MELANAATKKEDTDDGSASDSSAAPPVKRAPPPMKKKDDAASATPSPAAPASAPAGTDGSASDSSAAPPKRAPPPMKKKDDTTSATPSPAAAADPVPAAVTDNTSSPARGPPPPKKPEAASDSDSDASAPPPKKVLPPPKKVPASSDSEDSDAASSVASSVPKKIAPPPKKADPTTEAKEKAEKEAKESIEKAEKEAKESKEKAEKEAKEKAEKEAKEKAEKEAKEASEKESKEKAEREARDKADKELKEKAEKEATEAKEREAKEKAEKEAAEAKEKLEKASSIAIISNGAADNEKQALIITEAQQEKPSSSESVKSVTENVSTSSSSIPSSTAAPTSVIGSDDPAPPPNKPRTRRPSSQSDSVSSLTGRAPPPPPMPRRPSQEALSGPDGSPLQNEATLQSSTDAKISTRDQRSETVAGSTYPLPVVLSAYTQSEQVSQPQVLVNQIESVNPTSVTPSRYNPATVSSITPAPTPAPAIFSPVSAPAPPPQITQLPALPQRLLDTVLFSTLPEHDFKSSMPVPVRVADPEVVLAQQRTISEAQRSLVDKLSFDLKANAFAEAQRRRRDAELKTEVLVRRFREIPVVALDLEERLRSSLGIVAADTQTSRIRVLSDRIRATQASLALFKFASTSPSQLNAWNDVLAPFSKSARDDFRTVRSMLESSCSEESKQQSELQLNANVLAMCVEQARKLKAAAAAVSEEDIKRLSEAALAARATFSNASADALSASTSELRLELVNLQAGVTEYAEKIASRSEDERRAKDQQQKLSDEFTTLKSTVDKFRESESEQCSALASEVAALEQQAQSRLANESLALQSEIAAIRAVSAVEAERIGSQMVLKFREETEDAIEAVRSSATQRFQQVVDEVASLVSDEFDVLVSSIESQRAANEARVAKLREQSALITAQIEAIKKVSVMQSSMNRNSDENIRSSGPQLQARLQDEARLQQLKQRVRRLWDDRDDGLTLPSSQRAKLTFLLRAVREAPYSARLYSLLHQHSRNAQERRLIRDSDMSAAIAARNSLAGAASLASGGRAHFPSESKLRSLDELAFAN